MLHQDEQILNRNQKVSPQRTFSTATFPCTVLNWSFLFWYLRLSSELMNWDMKKSSCIRLRESWWTQPPGDLKSCLINSMKMFLFVMSNEHIGAAPTNELTSYRAGARELRSRGQTFIYFGNFSTGQMKLTGSKTFIILIKIRIKVSHTHQTCAQQRIRQQNDSRWNEN